MRLRSFMQISKKATSSFTCRMKPCSKKPKNGNSNIRARGRSPTRLSYSETTEHLKGHADRWFGSKRGLVLCDFGEARTGKDEYVEHVQPAPYRAPEVFLYLPWTKAIDIWNFGCMVWHIAIGEHLFPPQGEDELARDINQLARMVALLGPPPEALLADSGPRALEFFNEDGSPKGDVPNDTLESLLASSLDAEHEDDDRKMTTEESEMFLAFIRRALTWDDVKRPSASELFADPWVLDSILGKSSPSQS